MALELAIWDDTGELRYDMLAPSPELAHDFNDARKALTRTRSWPDQTRRMNRTDYVELENGALWGLKFKIEPPEVGRRKYRIFRDHLLMWQPNRQAELALAPARDASSEIFVLAFILSPAEDLPLGMYTVQQREGQIWRLQAVEPHGPPTAPPAPALPLPVALAGGVSAPAVPLPVALAGGAPAPAVPLPVALAGGAPAPAVPLPVALAGGAAPLTGPARSSLMDAAPDDEDAQPRRRQRTDGDVSSLRFLAGRNAFDSQLECVHYQAFSLLRLSYQLARVQCDLVAVLPGVRRSYTTDGLLYVRLGSSDGLESAVLVEIKPRDLSLEEAELCYAICRCLNQAVLCVVGGYAEARDADWPGVDLSLYVPNGPLAAPSFYPHVVWRWASPDLPPYLALDAPADPAVRLREQLHLRAIYVQATLEARQLARRRS